MKINFEGKQFEVFGMEEEVIDAIFVSLGFNKRPEIEALEEDDGKTPMHLLKKDVEISDNVLKENMTLTDLVNFVDMAFMAGINLVEIVRQTGKDKKELFEMADHIEFTPAAFMSTVKDFCLKNEDPTDSISAIFTYLVANYIVVSTRTGVDKFVCDTAGDKTASVTLKRGDDVVAEVDMVNETVSGKEAEAVSDFFVGLKGNFVCVKAKEQKPETKKDKEIEKACEKILEMADKPEEKKPEKKEVKEEKKPEKKEEPKQETKKETKLEVKDEKKEDHSKPSGKLVWNKETKQWEAPGTEPVVESKGETTIINNPTENVVLADTTQAVERLDLETLYDYTAEQGYINNVPDEDRDDVMFRVQAALKSLIVDPNNIKKFFIVGDEVKKYGIVKSNYINKNNFALTNGTKTWIFILDKDGNRKFNFLPTYKEAMAWSAEEKKAKASA